jgi:hypothetical protein
VLPGTLSLLLAIEASLLGAVALGEPTHCDHGRDIACTQGFPRDGSTTAEGFLFGFENLSPKDKASVQDTLEGGHSAKPAHLQRRGSSSSESEEASYGEEEDEEAGTEEDEDFFQQKRAFGSSSVPFPMASSVHAGTTTAFGGASSMQAAEAVPGLAKAASAAGMTNHFFAHPPLFAYRALRAAIEAFEISADVEELSDTLALINRLFA